MLVAPVTAKEAPHCRGRRDAVARNVGRHMVQVSQQAGGPRNQNAPPQTRIRCNSGHSGQNQVMAGMHGNPCERLVEKTSKVAD